MAHSIHFILNHEYIELKDFAPTDTLLDYLRLNKRLVGSKEGCAEGDCGACTVLAGRLIDGVLKYEGINACIRLLGSLHATHVITIEHLQTADGKLHPVQQAMVDYHGSQCGFCTPGFIMSLYGLWLSHDNPSHYEIERALQGNLCRCTGYEPIVRAAKSLAAQRPSSLFDPILKDREAIVAQLWTLHGSPSITVTKNEKHSIIPNTIEQFAEVYANNPKATIVAGSTDVGLWVTKQMRDINPVIFINQLTDLQTIQVDDDAITIDAGVTYAQAFETIAQHIPAFANLIDRIGGQQVRNMGTIGGNIANGSPIGDTPPALIALDALLHLRSATGTRTLKLEEYFIEYGKQNRQTGEFVEKITIPIPHKDRHFAVYKISKRRDEDISALCAAFNIKLSNENIVEDIRIAFGGMAGTPKRATTLEAALSGNVWNELTIQSALNTLDDDFQPLSDWRATAQYRQIVAKNLLKRFHLETKGEVYALQRFETEEA